MTKSAEPQDHDGAQGAAAAVAGVAGPAGRASSSAAEQSAADAADSAIAAALAPPRAANPLPSPAPQQQGAPPAADDMEALPEDTSKALVANAASGGGELGGATPVAKELADEADAAQAAAGLSSVQSPGGSSPSPGVSLPRREAAAAAAAAASATAAAASAAASDAAVTASGAGKLQVVTPPFAPAAAPPPSAAAVTASSTACAATPGQVSSSSPCVCYSQSHLCRRC